VAGIFAAGERAAAGYQAALARLQVNAHLSDAAIASMGRSVQQAAIGTTSSATSMADALAPVAGELARIQGGTLGNAAANQVLASSQDLVESSGASLSGATKTISDLLLVYHERADAAASVSNSLFQAHSLLGISVERLGMMLQRLQPRITGSGVDMQHLLGIVLQMAPAVGSGQRAMMLVGGILQTIQTPSKEAAKALKAVNVSLKDSTGAFIGFGPALDKIRGAMAGLHDPIARNALMTALFGHNANIAASLVAGGAAGIDKAAAALTKQGTAAAAAAKVSATLSAQMEVLQSTIETVLGAIGTTFLPFVTEIVTAINDVLTPLGKWIAANPDLATTILTVAGAIGVLGALLVFHGPILAAIGVILGGWVLPLVAVGAGIFYLATRLAAVGASLGPVRDFLLSVRGAFAQVASAVRPFIDSLAGLLSGRVSFAGFIESFKALIGALTGAGATILGALGQLGTQVTHWIEALIPVVVADVETLSATIWKAVVAALPGVVAGLTDMGQRVVAWLQDQLGVWAPILATWAHGITDWVVAAIPVVLRALVDFGGTVIDWIIAVAPQVASQMLSWAEGIANWLVDNGVPLVLGAFNTLVDSVANLIGDGSTIAKIATSIGQWTASFLGWAATTAAQAGAALVALLGYEITQNGGKIVGAAVTLATSIVGGIVNGLLSNPGALVEALGVLLAGSVVLSAVRWAAAKVAMEYTDAMRVAGMLADVVGSAWSALVGAIAAKVGLTGMGHGVIYTAGMKIVEALKGALMAAWVAMGLDPEILAKAFGAGTAAGTAEAEGMGAPAVLTAAGESGTAVGSAFGMALGAAAVAAVGLAMVQINDQLNRQAASLGSQEATWMAAPTTSYSDLMAGASATKDAIAAIRRQQAMAAGVPFLGGILSGVGSDQADALQRQLDQIMAAAAAKGPKPRDTDKLGASTVAGRDTEKLAPHIPYDYQPGAHGGDALSRLYQEEAARATKAAAAAAKRQADEQKKQREALAALMSGGQTALDKSLLDALGIGKTPHHAASGLTAGSIAAHKKATSDASASAILSAKQQLALAQAKAAGLDTSVMSAQFAIARAEQAVGTATDKVTAAENALADAKKAHYRNSLAREAAISKAADALAAAQSSLIVATDRVATAQASELSAENALRAKIASTQQAIAMANLALAKATTAAAKAMDEQRLATLQSTLSRLLKSLPGPAASGVGYASGPGPHGMGRIMKSLPGAGGSLDPTTITVSGTGAAEAISTGVAAGTISMAASGALLVAADGAWSDWQAKVLDSLSRLASAPSSPVTPKHVIENRIMLDSHEMKRWVSEVIATEVRSLSGPVVAGSGQ
jgi:TP901 family phage tail tape measure protein